MPAELVGDAGLAASQQQGRRRLRACSHAAAWFLTAATLSSVAVTVLIELTTDRFHTRALRFFDIGGAHYLAVGQKLGVGVADSLIYQWTGDSFAEFQRFPTNGVCDWEHFEINGTHYLAVANDVVNESPSEIDSLLYYWTGSSFAEFQRFPTNGARDWEHFEINGTHYLVVVAKKDSRIFYWTGSSFAELQRMPIDSGRDHLAWQHFDIEGTHYLAIPTQLCWDEDGPGTWHCDDGYDFLIYSWTGFSFAELQRIHSDAIFDSLEHFEIDDTHYLMPSVTFKVSSISGQLWNINPKIYRWTGTTFIQHQSNSNSNSLLLAAIAALVLVQYASWFLLRRLCRRSRHRACCGWWRSWFAPEHLEEGETNPFESMLSKRDLQAAEQRFQDELAGEGVAWLGLFVCLGALTFSFSLVYSLILWASYGGTATLYKSSNRAGGAGLLVMLALWLVCRFGFKRRRSRYSGIRRLLLCFPIPLFCVGMFFVESGGPQSAPAYGNILSFVLAISFMSLFVAPSSPGIQVGLPSLALYSLLVVWHYWADFASWASPNHWYQFGITMVYVASIHFIKRSKERMHREVVLAMQVQSTMLLTEKVQRCQAEFRYESVRDKLDKNLSVVDPQTASSYVESQCRSAMTAPAASWALLGQQAMWEQGSAGSAATCGGPDCLPENSLVQVEGSTDPRELRSVRVGDRVLCNDSLQENSCSYVQVVNVDVVEPVDDTPIPWLKIKLSDGSFITVTEDHPLRVHGHKEPGCVKLAAEVRPGRDSLKCMRLVDQGVVAVERGIAPPSVGLGGGVAGPPRRVSLTVQQGSRFSVLVSPAGSSAPLSALTAVGSADAHCFGRQPGGVMWQYGTRRLQQRSRLKRTSSDPTHLREGGFPAEPQLDQDTIPSEAGPDPWQTSPGAGPADIAGALHPGSSDDDGGYETAASTPPAPPAPLGGGTQGPFDLEQLLPELTVACRPAIVGLLLDHHQELGLELGEFFSAGSALHTGGGCTECPAFKRKEGCELGAECTLCHIPHVGNYNSRPPPATRKLLRRFSELLGGLYRQGGDEALRDAVAGLAADKPRFRELLQEHGRALLGDNARARGARSSRSDGSIVAI